MGVRILSVDGLGKTCLFDSVTDWAFGPVAEEDTITEFLKWSEEKGLPDPRAVSDQDLHIRWNLFLEQFTEEHDEGMSVVSD